MNEKRRLGILLAIVGILVIANFLIHFSGEDLEGGMFWSESTDLSAAISAPRQKILNDLQQTPRLSFQSASGKPSGETAAGRNPFIFGVDRRLEEERRRRMAALEATRREVETQHTAAPPVSEPEPPPFAGKILGVMESRADGQLTLALSLDQEIHTLHTGDRLEGYELLQITYAQIRFRRLADREELVIKLDSN